MVCLTVGSNPAWSFLATTNYRKSPTMRPWLRARLRGIRGSKAPRGVEIKAARFIVESSDMSLYKTRRALYRTASLLGAVQAAKRGSLIVWGINRILFRLVLGFLRAIFRS